MRRFSLLVGMALLWVAQLVVVPFSTGQGAPVLADPSGDVTAVVQAADTSAIDASSMGDAAALGGIADPVPPTTRSASMRTIDHAGEDPVRIMAEAERPALELALPSAPMGGSISLVAARLTYAPGAAMVVRRHTQMRLMVVEEGALEVRVDGEAARYSSTLYGGPLADEPLPVTGRSKLYAGDLLIIPVDAAFTARNTAEVPAVSLEISLQVPQPLTPMTDGVGAASGPSTIHREPLTAGIVTEPGQPAVVTIDRRILLPRTSLGVGKGPGTTVFLVKPLVAGTDQNRLAREHGKDVVRLVAPGEQPTMQTDAETPLVVMVLTVIPTDVGTTHQ